MCVPKFCYRRGLELGSQSTCIVGLVFPTEGNSTSNHSIASINPNEHPYSPLCVSHSQVLFICFLPLLLTFFSPEMPTTPPFSFYSPIYSLRWVEVL